MFGLHLPWPRVLAVVPLTGIVAIASYCFGTFLAGVVFRFRNLNSVVVLVGYVGLMTVCGVNVPLSYYPTALEWIARFLPLTNGLLAIRGVFDGEAWSWIIGHAALERRWSARCGWTRRSRCVTAVRRGSRSAAGRPRRLDSSVAAADEASLSSRL